MKEKCNWHQQCIVSPAVVLRWPFTGTCCTNPAYVVCCRKGGAFCVQWVRASAWRLHCRQSSQSFQFVPGSGISQWVCSERFSNTEIALAFRSATGTVGRVPHLSREDADVFGVWCLSCLEPRSLCTALVSEQYLGIQDLSLKVAWILLHLDEYMEILLR